MTKPKSKKPVTLSKLAKTDQFLTAKQTARLIGVTYRILTYWRKQKRGPGYYKFGTMIRYKIYDINKWLKSHRVKPEGMGKHVNKRGGAKNDTED